MIELQFLFANQASTIQEAAKNYLHRQQGMANTELAPLNMLLFDYIDKAAVLADRLQLPHQGTEAWSDDRQPKPKNKEAPMIKVADSFARILEDIPAEGTNQDGGESISFQEMLPDPTSDIEGTACADTSRTDGAVNDTDTTSAAAMPNNTERSSPIDNTLIGAFFTRPEPILHSEEPPLEEPNPPAHMESAKCRRP